MVERVTNKNEKKVLSPYDGSDKGEITKNIRNNAKRNTSKARQVRQQPLKKEKISSWNEYFNMTTIAYYWKEV